LRPISGASCSDFCRLLEATFFVSFLQQLVEASCGHF
jgi:hypothetical protein